MEFKMAITGLGMRRVVLAAVFLGGTSVLPMAALSEEIALRSADGLIDFSGEFVALDDDHYIVRTALGELRVRADRPGCARGTRCRARHARSGRSPASAIFARDGRSRPPCRGRPPGHP